MWDITTNAIKRSVYERVRLKMSVHVRFKTLTKPSTFYKRNVFILFFFTFFICVTIEMFDLLRI